MALWVYVVRFMNTGIEGGLLSTKGRGYRYPWRPDPATFSQQDVFLPLVSGVRAIVAVVW